MISLSGSSADELWLKARERFLSGDAARVDGRGSETLELRPVMLSLADPQNRWVFSRTPALNPAAVLSEVVWILRGRNDSKFVNFWNNSLRKYAGDGDSYYGAYGHRLRHAFEVDQLADAAAALAANPDSRQVCLSIWDPRTDLPVSAGEPRSADIPCNVASMLKVREGRLEWTQVMRSNDFWLGLPFNIVQFTMLQEVLAGWIGVGVGAYHHLSDSLHLYPADEAYLRGVTPVAAPRSCASSFAEVGRNRSEQLVKAIEERLDPLIDIGSATEAAFTDAEPPLDWPEAYANLLRILLAEAARRQVHVDLAVHLMGSCTDPALGFLWSRWCERLHRAAAEA